MPKTWKSLLHKTNILNVQVSKSLMTD